MQFRICHRLCCYSTCVVKVEERDEQCLLPLDETCPLITWATVRYNLVLTINIATPQGGWVKRIKLFGITSAHRYYISSMRELFTYY